jgi:hypothetical protein
VRYGEFFGCWDGDKNVLLGVNDKILYDLMK